MGVFGLSQQWSLHAQPDLYRSFTYMVKGSFNSKLKQKYLYSPKNPVPSAKTKALSMLLLLVLPHWAAKMANKICIAEEKQEIVTVNHTLVQTNVAKIAQTSNIFQILSNSNPKQELAVIKSQVLGKIEKLMSFPNNSVYAWSLFSKPQKTRVFHCVVRVQTSRLLPSHSAFSLSCSFSQFFGADQINHASIFCNNGLHCEHIFASLSSHTQPRLLFNIAILSRQRGASNNFSNGMVYTKQWSPNMGWAIIK